MQIKSKAIFLSSLRHQEKNFILNFYTLEKGLVTFYTRSNSKKGKALIPSAIFALSEVDFSFKESRNIQTLHSYDIEKHFIQEIHPFRASVLFFIVELIKITILEGVKDSEKFTYFEHLAYLSRSINLDNLKSLPVYFLLTYAAILGIYPEDAIFNEKSRTLPQIAENELLIEKISGLNKNERNSLTNELLLHYKMHLEGFNGLKSLSVLRELYT